MRLTRQADFSLRTLLFLARQPGELSTVGEIARAYQVSENHLVKVAHRLGRAGFVVTVRGHAGGLRLGRPASAIGIGDVVRAMEPDLDLVECFDRAQNTCLVASACSLKGVLYEARHAFVAVLDRYTLADLVAVPGMLHQLKRLGT